MKFISNNKILFKLIVALCIFLILISFGCPKEVHAEGWFEAATGTVETGGKLLTPIIDLVLALFDGVLDVLHQAVMGTESAITIDTAVKRIIGIAAAILAVLAVAALTLLTGPLAGFIGTFLAKVVIGVAAIASVSGISWAYTGVSGAVLPDITILPTYSISPEEIFKGEILLFDVNIFNPKEQKVALEKDGSGTIFRPAEEADSYLESGYKVKYYFYCRNGYNHECTDDCRVVTSANNSAAELKNVVSSWFYTIRNFALVGSMVVLAYVGIRMMISTTASEKSKYKQMLGDWVVAMVLIFVMQYIMIFANSATESITSIFASVANKNQYVTVIKDADQELIDGVKELGMGDTVSGKDISWPSNLMGRARLLAQQHNGTPEYVGYALCFVVLVIFTIIFTVTYAKRLLYIVFFSIISPLVALTYPLDKINDGKAQAFNIWLKEYIFNLLIQPFHLLLYTVLISTAFELAGTNIIYTLVAIGFMIPAEKFLRKMFGFEKSSTPGFLDGAAGGALAMHGLQSLQKMIGKGDKGGNQANQDNGKIDFMDRGANSGSFKTNKLIHESLGNPQGRPEESPQERPVENSQGNPQGRPVENSQGNPQGNSQGRPVENSQGNPQGNPQGRPVENLQGNPQGRPVENLQGNPQEKPVEKSQGNPQGGPVENSQVNPQGWPEENPQEDYQIPDFVDYSNMPWFGEKGERKENFSKKAKATWEIGKQYGGARFSNFKAAVGENFKDKDARKSALRKSVKTLAKVGGTAGGAIIGAASDIASNSFGKDTAAGAIAGGVIGTGAANIVTNSMEKAEIQSRINHEEALKEMYGDNYSDYIKKRKDDMFKKDARMREMYSREFSSELAGLKGKERSKALDGIMDHVIEYRKYGVKDNGTIIKAMKMEEGNASNRIDKDRIVAAKLSEVSKTEKDLQTTMSRLNNTQGLDKDQIKVIENRIRQINNL